MERSLCFLLLFLFHSYNLEVSSQGKKLPYILDMVHSNPGEPMTQTKYNDPEFLQGIGYTGMVPQWHVQCAITYDSFQKDIIPSNSPDRKWIMEKQLWIKEKLKRAKQAGLSVYPFVDMLVIPTLILEKYSSEIVRQQDAASGYDAIHGKLVPDISHLLTQELVEAQISELFETFPDLDGLVIRFGETYLFDTPFHSGGNPIRYKGEEGIKGHVKLIELLRKEVCEKYNKKLFYRTWDFGFFHTDPAVYTRITDQIAPHSNLLFSIKYTCGDFHRLTQFNPTLGIGRHNYIIEFQGQPEYYGKGAHPVYVFGGMLNGFTEYKQNMPSNACQSIAELTSDSKFQGLWTWSRGGGWRGPYINNELWCDVNTYAAAAWAQDTTMTETETLNRILPMVGVKKEFIPSFIDLLHKADVAVLKGQCTVIDIKKSRFNVWWTRDQYFSGEKSLSGFLDYIIANGKEEEMLAEKREAVNLWKEIETLSMRIEMCDPQDMAYLRTSATYGRIKHEIISNIFVICLYGKKRKGLESSTDREKLKNAIDEYDRLWEEWKNLRMKGSDCATLYEPNAFSLKGMEGVTGDPLGGIGATVEKYRKELLK